MKRKQFGPELRLAVYNKTDGHCAYCGKLISISKMQIDHIRALHVGGSNEMSNLLPSCASCNHWKSTMTLKQFRDTVRKSVHVLMRDSVTFRNAVRFGVVSFDENTPITFYFERMNNNE